MTTISQDRFVCRGCGRVIAHRRRGKVAPTASGRIVVVVDGRVLIACVHCGHRLWVPMPKPVVR